MELFIFFYLTLANFITVIEPHIAFPVKKRTPPVSLFLPLLPMNTIRCLMEPAFHGSKAVST